MKASQRQRLKHDKYAETVVHGLGWAREHLALITIVVAAILAVTIGVSWYSYTRERAEETANDLLSEIESTAAQAAYNKSSPTHAEEIKVIVQRYETVAKEYSETAVAPQALLKAAELLNGNGQYEEAIGYYRQALEISAKYPGAAALARRGLAEALEASGKYKEAIEQYRFFTAKTGSPEVWQALWNIGRCYELAGDAAGAKESYQKLAEAGGSSEWADLARYRLSALERGQIATPLPPPPATTTTLPETPTTTLPVEAGAIPEAEETAPVVSESPEVAVPPTVQPETTATTLPDAPTE